jgi:hypothetical protein
MASPLFLELRLQPPNPEFRWLTFEPERISEVVSDIVESQSGYLEVGFEVPSGGAFRVIDVIVTEAPRFNP